MERPDPFWLVFAGLWAWVPFTAMRIALAWNELPLRMATHFDDQWRPNGWSTRGDALWMVFIVLGIGLVATSVPTFFVRFAKPSHSWPVLVLSHFGMVIVGWGANTLITHNLP
jgi:uncharacterized membrane protein